MTTRLLALVIAACSLPAQAADAVMRWRDWPPDPQWAQTRPFAEGPPPIERASFAALDTNRDFMLSREEAAASPAVEGNFDRADLDGDARLAPLEFNNLAFALAERVSR